MSQFRLLREQRFRPFFLTQGCRSYPHSIA